MPCWVSIYSSKREPDWAAEPEPDTIDNRAARRHLAAALRKRFPELVEREPYAKSVPAVLLHTPGMEVHVAHDHVDLRMPIGGVGEAETARRLAMIYQFLRDNEGFDVMKDSWTGGPHQSPERVIETVTEGFDNLRDAFERAGYGQPTPA